VTIRALAFDADGTLWDAGGADAGDAGAGRHRAVGDPEPYDDVAPMLGVLSDRYVVGLIADDRAPSGRLTRPFAFRLAADEVGIGKPDPRLFAMAAAAAGCHPNELVSIGDDPAGDVVAAQALGCRAVLLDRHGAGVPAGVEPDAVISSLAELPAVLARFEADDATRAAMPGVGPHPEPWPAGDHLDPALLADGDRRNVVDGYRYWTEAAIVADLAGRRHGFHVAVENWRHDRNIGAVVRNANAFGAAGVHIIGRRRWNRRGAMATDRYLDVRHHDTVEAFLDWASTEALPVVAIDNVDGSVPIETSVLPERCVLAFGQEGPGVSTALLAASALTCEITQHGSTRSLNAGVASGIAMYAWLSQHARG
jgi:tRNA(Leu) C34 or U34 (ribose-2'-O)-methylase TrmL